MNHQSSFLLRKQKCKYQIQLLTWRSWFWGEPGLIFMPNSKHSNKLKTKADTLHVSVAKERCIPNKKLWNLPALDFARDGCTTTCMIITPPAISPNGALHWPTVLLFSKILPELINFTSFADFGRTVLPTICEKYNK